MYCLSCRTALFEHYYFIFTCGFIWSCNTIFLLPLMVKHCHCPILPQMVIRWRAWTQSACRLLLLQMDPLHTSNMTPKPLFQMVRSWMVRWSSWRTALLPTFSMCPCPKQVKHKPLQYLWTQLLLDRNIHEEEQERAAVTAGDVVFFPL